MVAVGYVGIDVQVKCGDSKSNGSRDSQGADFVSNERTSMTEADRIRRKRVTGVSPTNSRHRIKS